MRLRFYSSFVVAYYLRIGIERECAGSRLAYLPIIGILEGRCFSRIEGVWTRLGAALCMLVRWM